MTARNHSVLITGANSGLGFEAAYQLAEAGFSRVILACRSQEKADEARRALSARLGADPFETLVVDVSSIESAETAARELIERGKVLDALLLNAGMVSGDELRHSADGYELAFASSVIGHHVLALRLLEAGLVNQGARIVLSGSEAANGNLPAMMDMQLYDFADGIPHEFGDDLVASMANFARAELSQPFNPTRYYAVTKVFSAWWSAALQRRTGDDIQVFTVSPGASLGTNAARHMKGFKRLLFTKIMPTLGPVLGMDQPVPVAAKRYVDVLTDRQHRFRGGHTYTSRPRKMVGPLHEVDEAHIVDFERQEAAWTTLVGLTGVGETVQRGAVA